jgi:hypothetical protein
MVWSGELREDFRPEAEGIVGTTLTDEAWHGLCRVVMGYSILLSHEHNAVSLSEQAKATHKAVVACEVLIEALQTIQQPQYGTLLSGLVTDKWEEVRGRQRDAERNQSAMADDIDALDGRRLSLLRSDGEPEEEEGSVGWELIRSWRSAGRIEVPSVGEDLLVQLREVQHALKIAHSEIKSGKTYKTVKGEAFDALVGRLDEWQDRHGLGIGATKQGDHGSYGRLTNLVKAVLAEVPILRGDDDKPLDRQIRRPVVSDASLADAVLEARTDYRSRKQGELGAIIER